MAEFKLGRIRFVWKGDWVTGTTYFKDDIVRYGGRTYLCVIGHTAAAGFETDLDNIPSRWNRMSEGQAWAGDWTVGFVYKPNDIVKYGGYLYICLNGHTSAATATLGLEADQAKWQIFAETFDWKTNWDSNVRYKINDVVKYGGQTYSCNEGHTSGPSLAITGISGNGTNLTVAFATQPSAPFLANTSVHIGGVTPSTLNGDYKVVSSTTSTVVLVSSKTFTYVSGGVADGSLENDQSKWDLIAESFDWKGDWDVGTTYKVNDVVKYGGQTYVCNTGHASAESTTLGLEADQSKWDYFNRGFDYKGEWSGSSVRYKVNDVVKFGPGLWICITHHTSTATFDTSKWQQFVEGLEFNDNYSTTIEYQPGDVVTYGGYAYVAKTYNVNKVPVYNTADWDLYASNFRLRGDWLDDDSTDSSKYRVGDVVRLGGYTYVCIQNSIGDRPSENPLYWSRLNSGIKWKGEWTNSTQYDVGDAVRYGSNSYICILPHISADDDSTTVGDVNKSPETDGTIPGINGIYWNVLTGGNEESVLTVRGDIVYYSGSGPTRLPIGQDGMILKVDTDTPVWGYWGVVSDVYYVATHGVDSPSPEYGLTIDKPWRTVRYACEQLEDGVGYPNAKMLLRLNRTFIQAEVVEWVDYQVANNIGIFNGFTVDDKEKCRRDIGLILDAMIYDLTHGSNTKIREATQSYFSSGSLIAAIADEEEQLVESIEYMVTLIDSVLSNNAPASNYQALNGIALANRVKQYIDYTYTEEVDAQSKIEAAAVIINTCLTANSLASLPAEDRQAYTINVKTGLFEEVLPIVLPVGTAVVGDELRGTRISPAGKLIATNDKDKTVAALTRLKSITSDIILNNTVTPTSGNTVTQNKDLEEGNTGSSSAVTSVETSMDVVYSILNGGLGYVPAFTFPSPTGYNTSFLIGYGDARAQITANLDFIQDEIIQWIAAQIAGAISPFSGSFTYDAVACRRDVGYILDSLRYDLSTGGNLETIVSARAYYSYGEATFGSGEKEETLAALAHLKDVVGYVIDENTSWSKNTSLTQDTSGTAGSAASKTFAQARIQEIYDTIDNDGTEPTEVTPSTSWVATALVTAKTALSDYRTSIRSDSVAYIKTQYPSLAFNETTCSRDVGYIVDAIAWDMVMGGNFRSVKAGMSYYRATSSAQTVIADQKAATLGLLLFVKKRASQVVTTGSAVLASELWDDIIGYIDTGVRPLVGGTNTPTTDETQINGAIVMMVNKEFFAQEALAYTNTNNTTSVTDANVDSSTSNEFTCASTAWMKVGDAVRFTGTVFGGVSTGTTYYVHTVQTSTTFKVSATLGGAEFTLTTGSGSMTVSYYYDQAACARDVRAIIDAIYYDLIYVGNYKSVYAGRYYRNALTGSKLEDAFYVRNACGLRNMTFLGLDGSSDGNTTNVQSPLTTANQYGTQRTRAGAWASLDPGWGPNDSQAWTTNKSTYIQNITTFGIGCIGQKIDGIIHSGGNKSIVSNDFTQVLSDGIGAYVTNLGLAELVSVFTYYNYIGYLAENGGKIRATNGNNSYGTFGSIAEGVDNSETVVSGKINNRSSEASIRSVYVGGGQVLRFEYGNAGSNYTSAIYTISGAGINAAAIGDEIRDGAVYEVRLTDPGDSSGTGGSDYTTASNVAQTGNTTQVTIAAADTAETGDYNGMSIYITSGTGAGQYGYIGTFTASTKVATVFKESDGTAGWDHVVPGTTIAAGLDVTTAYTISPRLTFSAPSYSSAARTISSSHDWKSVTYGDNYGSYTNVVPTSGGTGNNASFNIIRNKGAYAVTVSSGGFSYVVGDVLTIAGTSVGGAAPANNITITVDTINVDTGAIQQITVAGTAIPSRWVAVANDSGGTNVIAYSENGTSWTNATISASAEWTGIAYGTISGIGYWVAVSSGSNVAAYSIDGVNWTAAALPSSGSWRDVTYGQINGVGRFMAVRSGSNAAGYSTNGTSWTATSALPASTTWTSVAASKAGVFVAIASGGTQAASSTNGTSWTSRTLPATADWSSVIFGNGRFVAVSTTSSDAAAFTINGADWTSSTLPSSEDWTDVGYGNGVFFAVASGASDGATSEDGLSWTARALQSSDTWNCVAHGNPAGTGIFAALATGGTAGQSMLAGRKAQARSYVSDGEITEIWITEPGSNYTAAPTMTITDPNNTIEATFAVRIGNGALGQPTFTNRGTSYSASSATVSGDGYRDSYQTGSFIACYDLDQVPQPGSNITVAGINDVVYRLVTVTALVGSEAPYAATLQFSPPIEAEESPDHDTAITLRRRYSQVRLTGHDFLDIGTGNQANTNYPGLPLSDPIPANETVDLGGGRVFYTSTDQDGNFRVGGLFNVEQATGIATLNADAFNIAGLNELQLGSVALGGQGATISEFSTDPFFTQDSDSVVPTQRAIKAYITSQIGGGGSSINVNTLTAGVVFIAGNSISTTTGVQINVNTKMNFTGGVDGSPVALNYFLLG